MLLGTGMPARAQVVSDNFDAYSNTAQFTAAGWILTSLNPALVSTTFVPNGAGKALRLQANPVPNTAPAVGGWYRTNDYTDFYFALDLANWPGDTKNQAFVMFARLTDATTGTVVTNQDPANVQGIICNYDTSQYGENPGDRRQGQLQINIVNAGFSTITLAAADITLIPGRPYRIVFKGVGNNLSAQAYDWNDLTTPLVTIANVDDISGFTHGGCGLVGFSRQGTSGTVDITYDNYYSGPSDPNPATPPALAHPIPGTPAVDTRTPSQRWKNFHSPALGVGFTANTWSATVINASATKLRLNGVDVSAQLVLSANGTNISGTLPGSVLNMERTTNALYSAELVVTDVSGTKSSTNTFFFDTFSDAYLRSSAVKTIEAEEYNYNGGTNQWDPIPVSGLDTNGSTVNGGGVGYYDLVGTAGIDYSNNAATPDANFADFRTMDAVRTLNGGNIGIEDGVYPSPPPNIPGSDNVRSQHAASNLLEYVVVRTEPNEWLNYTRAFDTAFYAAYLRYSSFGATSNELHRVTSDPTQPNQTTTKLGTFRIPNNIRQVNYLYTPLVDDSGKQVLVNLTGTNTLRLLMAGTVGNDRRKTMLNYVMLVKAPAFSCAPNKTVACGANWTFDPPTVSGPCGGGNVTITVLSTVTNGGPCPAVITRTWQVTDACFNTAMCSQTVTVLAPLESGVTTLVSTGACWRYNDRGLNLGTEWTNLGYEDSTWSLGFAPLGYGHGNEATVVSFGPDQNHKYITTYFRRTFDVPDPTVFTNLLLRLKQDDGAAVYLNGVEIFRSNLPPGPPNYLTLASTEAAGTNFIVANVSPTNLLQGENALAVEIHQAAANGPDISFDLGFVSQYGAAKPVLSVVRAGGNKVVLAWPASASSNFVLQSASTLTAASWTGVSNAVVEAGGMRYVTNAITGSQRFYRLCAASVNLSPCQPPIVLSQPLKVEVPAGTNVSLNVVVDGDGPFTYAWRKNQRSANGTNATLTLTNVTRETGGGYDVLICNGCECIFSCPIQLIVGGTNVALADNFVNRPIFTTASAQLNTSNVVATTEAGEPVNPAGTYGRTVWLQWTAPASGIAVFDTKGSALGTAVAVYTGNALSNLVRQTYSGLSDRAFNSAVVFNAIAGTNYQVQLDGFGPTASLCVNWQLTVTTNAAPQIVQQPQSQYVEFGSNAVFVVQATLPPPLTNSLLSYQWFKEGIPVAGATSSTFILPAIATNNIAQYVAAMSFNGLSTTSDVVNLVGHGSVVGSGSICAPTTSAGGQYSCAGTPKPFDHHVIYYFRVPMSPLTCTLPACNLLGSDLWTDPNFQPIDTSSGSCVGKAVSPPALASGCGDGTAAAINVKFDTVTATLPPSVDTLLYVALFKTCSPLVVYQCKDDINPTPGPTQDLRTTNYLPGFFGANVSAGFIKVILMYNSNNNILLNYRYCASPQ